jgi:hypothetical protein
MKTLREIVVLIESYDNNIDNLSLDGARDIIRQIVGTKCPNCLHGFRRDVEQADGSQQDEECGRCDGIGYLG